VRDEAIPAGRCCHTTHPPSLQVSVGRSDFWLDRAVIIKTRAAARTVVGEPAARAWAATMSASGPPCLYDARDEKGFRSKTQGSTAGSVAPPWAGLTRRETVATDALRHDALD
jgi:hypothetical protein